MIMKQSNFYIGIHFQSMKRFGFIRFPLLFLLLKKYIYNFELKFRTCIFISNNSTTDV